MELRTHDQSNVFEDIIEDQIVDEEDLFSSTSMEEELENEEFYKGLEELENLLKLDINKIKETVKDSENLKILFEKNKISIESEDLKDDIRELGLSLEVMFINNIIYRYIDSVDNSISLEGEDSWLSMLANFISSDKNKGTSPFHTSATTDGIKRNLELLSFFKRRDFQITIGIIAAVLISFRIYHGRSFMLNPRYYKDKMAKLKNKKRKYNPNRIVKTIPASILNDVKRNGLSAVNTIEKIVDNIVNGADTNQIYTQLTNLNLSDFGIMVSLGSNLSASSKKKNFKIKVKRNSINRKIKKTTSSLGYNDKSFDSLVKDLNGIREKFIKAHDKIVTIQINVIENPGKYKDIKSTTVKQFLPAIIKILKYVFDTVFRNFYNTIYAIK